MEYIVNFHEDPNTSGNILLKNVVMNGKIYTPNGGDTKLFTKDTNTGNLKREKVDLANITYRETPVSTGSAAPSSVPSPVPSSVSGVSGVSGGTQVAPQNKLQAAENAILNVINLLSPDNSSVSPTMDDVIKGLQTAVTSVENAMDNTDTNKYILEKIRKTVEDLKTDSASFDAANLPTILSELNKEYIKLTYKDNKDNKIPGGAPLRFGSSSSKTNRNRRRNRRFAKKSYKRRR